MHMFLPWALFSHIFCVRVCVCCGGLEKQAVTPRPFSLKQGMRASLAHSGAWCAGLWGQSSSDHPSPPCPGPWPQPHRCAGVKASLDLPLLWLPVLWPVLWLSQHARGIVPEAEGVGWAGLGLEHWKKAQRPQCLANPSGASPAPGIHRDSCSHQSTQTGHQDW